MDAITRATARMFVGFPLCRNEDWLSLNMSIVRDIILTLIIMRNFPPWLCPLIGVCIPSRRKIRRSLRRITLILTPMIEERRLKEKTQGSAYEKPEDVIQYMMDLANEKESNPEAIATRYVFTILGSMHIVMEGLVDTLYEIIARPEYLIPLRTEMEQVLTETDGWQKGTALKMRKLDSFMKEAQRQHPPISREWLMDLQSPLIFWPVLRRALVALRRIVTEPITLSDGLHLPKGAYIATIAASHIQEEVAAPGTFDGFRYEKRSLEQDSGRYQYTSSDSDHMAFGIGRYACPGRFAASMEIKMVIAAILLRYDLKFLEGKGRPDTIRIFELQFNNPTERIMARRRVN